MRPDQIFGIIVILLAIYLGLTAADRDVTVDLFDGDTTLDLDGDGTDGGAAGGGTGGEPVLPPPDTGEADADPAPDGQGDADGQAESGAQPSAADPVDIAAFCVNAPATSSFTDVDDTHAAAVRCIEAAGVVNGVSATTFAPDDAVTRGQTASMIDELVVVSNRLEAEGADLRALPDAPDPRFRDVPPSSPHAEAIANLNEVGILEGYVDARYEPNQPVTRAQMASVIDRTHRVMTGDALPVAGNAFVDDDASVHHEAINAVATADIVSGDTQGRFHPTQSVDRGQMASMLARFMAHLEQSGRIDPLP